MDKVMSLDQAVEGIQDGATIMLGGFLGVGAPLKSIDKLVEIGVKDLTVISLASGHPAQDFDVALLCKNKQVKKLITSHAGTSRIALDQYSNGELEIEYFPLGSFAEKIRAGGAGLGGALTPTGLGTLAEKGKEKLTIQGREYLLELPLRADFAFIKGYRGDRFGNIQYRGVAVSSNPVMATAGDFTVAEVNEIVDVGSIQPESVGTPSVFVHAVVQGHPFETHKKIYTDLWVRSKQFNKSAHLSEEAKAMDAREMIARRAATELRDGQVVNLGIGMPTAVANYLPADVVLTLQSENGCLLFGPTPSLGDEDPDVANAGGQPISLLPGASIFDLATSFAIIRGGHVDVSILGALEVDQEGSIANWARPLAPGKFAPGMGGAMDLVFGARKVVVTVEHSGKAGSKILKKCRLPITGKGVVDVIITEKAVFEVTGDGLVLAEMVEGLAVDDIREITEADFVVAENVRPYQLSSSALIDG